MRVREREREREQPFADVRFRDRSLRREAGTRRDAVRHSGSFAGRLNREVAEPGVLPEVVLRL